MAVLVERSVHHIPESWLRFISLKKKSKKRLSISFTAVFWIVNCSPQNLACKRAVELAL
jgi:hypothetical protein